jgi:hypothetical protein
MIQMKAVSYPSLVQRVKNIITGKKVFEYSGAVYPCYCAKRINHPHWFNPLSLNSVLLCEYATFETSNYASNHNIALCFIDSISAIKVDAKLVLDIKNLSITDVRGNIIARIV